VKKVSTLLVQHLLEWGVTHVFGIPGKPVTPFIKELDEKGITFVLSKHEAGAGYEAAGYAMANKTMGVAIGTSGPGATNLLTAAGQAKAYHLPVLFLTGHPSMRSTGQALGQDSTFFGTDVVRMFESVTRFSARVERGELFRMYFEHAVAKAYEGSKGPVHLSIPADVLAEEIESFALPLPSQAPSVMSTKLRQAVEIVQSAKRPVLFVGKGVHAAEAYGELEALAYRLQIPVMTTPGGKGAFQSNHPLSLGAFGLGGTEAAKAYLEEGIDVMIVLGTKLSDMSLAGFHPGLYPKKIIQFDADPTFIGKSLPVPTISIIGDIKVNLQMLLEHLPNKKDNRMFEMQAPSDEMVHTSSTDEYMSAAHVMQVLRSELPGNTVVFGDDGSHTFYAIRHFDITKPGTFFFDDVFGAMGHGIGYAIGAKIALPNTPVVCLTGDGCTFMHGAEISTAVEYEAHVIFVILNNGRLDMVDKGMAKHLGHAVGTTYRIPLHIAEYAAAMGASSFRCEREEQLREAVQTALREPKTTVIEIMVDPFEIPPTMSRG
jgi:acetolactate synthase-1/2/3 large subunit